MIHFRWRMAALILLAILVIGSGTFPMATAKAQQAMPRFVQVSAGEGHALAVGADGTLWAWGDNSTGELGDGTYVTRTVPVQVGKDSNWAFAAAGDKLSAAIQKDGSLWIWGTNQKNAYIGYQQGIINKNIPFRYGKDKDWVKLSLGAGGMAAIRKDGTLWQFGLNVLPGVISNGKLNSDKDWTEVSIGENGLLALKKDGSLWGMGGIVPSGDNVERLTRLSDERSFDQIAASVYSVVRKKDGSVWMLRMDQDTRKIILKPVDAIASAAQITGAFVSVILDTEGSVWKWDTGYDEYQMMICPENISYVDDGGTFGAAIDDNGRLLTYGSNTWGQRGDGSANSAYEPVTLDADVADIVLTDSNIYTLRKDGSLYIYNEYLSDTDQRLGMDNDWISIEGNREELYAIKRDGSLWTYRSSGRAPSGMAESTALDLEPFQEGTYWRSVQVGDLGYAVGLRTDGTLWFWGRDSWGMVMKNTQADQFYSPVKLSGNTNWQSFSLSYSSIIAVQNNGTLWGLGDNRLGQLGLSVTASPKVNSFTKIGNYSDWVTAKIGETTAIGIRKNGTLWQWGAGFTGGIRYTPKTAAAMISQSKDWVNLWTAARGAYAMKKDGSLWAWGDNGFGQLGIGTAQSVAVPTRVKGSGGAWNALFTSHYYTIGLKKDGSLWKWGNDGSESKHPVFVSQTELAPVAGYELAN
ncbi:hypothetical protein [Paenibacillus sp. NFR01]|uniref:RCC1 domain-containing protein n=1 Tax=Paenibacillus sp. NFR01 TaxID=1566279 RepID=UPI0008B8418E|nr:hypothetical protein [Paenibacillus sp. NFR01]SET07485.1 Alpha-tubulin suppressor [Paenibacillus sp. NFR01]